MATRYESITPKHSALIQSAPLFFIATAHPAVENGPLGEGAVNLSPKGDTRLVVIDPKTVAYLDFTGSGNQTALHIAAGSDVTVMVCSFEQQNAGIVRLFGSGRVLEIENYPRRDLLTGDSAGEIALPERQVIEISVDSTMTSCGYGVPVSEGFRPRTVSDRGRAYK